MRAPQSSSSAKSYQELTDSSPLSPFRGQCPTFLAPIISGKPFKMIRLRLMEGCAQPGIQTNKNNPQHCAEGGVQVLGREGEERVERLRWCPFAGGITGDVMRLMTHNRIIRCDRTGHCKEHLVPQWDKQHRGDNNQCSMWCWLWYHKWSGIYVSETGVFKLWHWLTLTASHKTESTTLPQHPLIILCLPSI